MNYEDTLDPALRKKIGAYYTPLSIVSPMVTLTLTSLIHGKTKSQIKAIRVLDPACGTGNFLIEVINHLARIFEDLGDPPEEALESASLCVYGMDVDEDAVSICILRILKLTQNNDLAFVQKLADNIAVGDSLTHKWDQTFDLVIGNPPFLGQLKKKTVSERSYAKLLQAKYRSLPYTDIAGLFVLLALELSTNQVCLIQPISVLSARDSQPVREQALAAAALKRAWFLNANTFEAAIHTCVLQFDKQVPCGLVDIYTGQFEHKVSLPPPTTNSWGYLFAATQDVPRISLKTLEDSKGKEVALCSIAEATSDFRDQYYGLAHAVVDLENASDNDYPKLITVGLIDPANCKWGKNKAKFNKVSYLHPRVDLSLLDDKLKAWAKSRMVPKVLVATQGRILEVIVDEEGTYLPSVPVLTVTAPVNDLWDIAALLSSPPVTALAAQRHMGLGLSPAALRLRPADLLDIPLPADLFLWDDAGFAFKQGFIGAEDRRDALIESAELMCNAYGVDSKLFMPWWTRLLK